MKPVFSTWSEDDNEEEQEPFRTRIFRKGVGIIDMQYSDNETIMYCPYCSAAGFKVKLQARILMDGEKRAPDYDQWLSCPDCYAVVAAYTVEGDASIIKDDIATIETPFDNSTEIIGVSPKRNSPRGRRTTARRRRNRTTHPDKDIQMELDRHGSDKVHIIEDSNP